VTGHSDPPEELDGRFRLEGDMVAGGMGTVYRAVDLATGEIVAVKISSSFGSQFGERFLQETAFLAEIAHPAIVRYLSHGRTRRGEHYLVMEWLDGETLEDRLRRGALSLPETLSLARRIGEALAAAHGHGIVHRDIKPANIFLPGRDLSKIKLLDFGIARRLFDTVSLRLTQAGSALGTPMYMSPEQARGSPDVDARADIFSMGCVLFECITGTPPFWGESTTGTLAKVTDDSDIDVAERCQGVSPRFMRLMGRMLAKKVEARPDSMNEVLFELSHITSELRTVGTLGVIPLRSAVPVQLTTTGERRLAAVILVSAQDSPGGRPRLDPAATALDLGTVLARELVKPDVDDHIADVARVIAPFGARIQRLANGGLVVTLLADGLATPMDLAVRAARCCLRLKLARPGSSFALTVGHALVDEQVRLGNLIDGAARLLTHKRAGTIQVSDEIRRMLEARFEIIGVTDGVSRLLFERGLREAPRTVLGKDVPCIGREREISGLANAFEGCVDEPRAQAIVLTGGPGSGKSRISYEFLERVRDRGKPFELLVGRGDPMRANVSLGLLAEAIRGAAGIGGTESEESQRERLIAHAGRHLPPESAETTVAFLGEIAGIPFPDENLSQLRAARLDPRLMADQTQAAWVDWLEAETQHRPVLLLLEDLHWGDGPSVQYTDAALRVLREAPFMVLALARPEVDQRFSTLWRDRQAQRIPIAPLGKRAIEEMARRILGDKAEGKLQWILDQAQGNPFYLEELARVLAWGKDVAEVPSTVIGMVQMRFEAAGEGAKQVLRAASVFGRSFRAAGVKALLAEMIPDDIDRWLEILVKREILFARPFGDSREHVFRHALHRDAAYALLPPESAVAGHRLAGEFLEQAGEHDAILLADHFERGNEAPRAVRWLRVAANQAMEASDLSAAISRAERGMLLGAKDDDLAELRIVESEALYWQGNYARAENVVRGAQACTDPGLGLRAKVVLIDSLGVTGKFAEIKEMSHLLDEEPKDPSLMPLWLECILNVTGYLSVDGDLGATRRALGLVESKGESLTPYLSARIETLRSQLARADGRLSEALDHQKLTMHLHESAGRTRDGCSAVGNLAVWLLEIGQLEEAEEEARRMLGMSERMGLNHFNGGVLQILTNCLAYQGRLHEARAMGLLGLAWTMERGDHWFLHSTQLYLSMTEYFAGDYPAAEGYARGAVENTMDKPSMHPFALALLARARLAQGFVDEALAFAREAYAAIDTKMQIEDGEVSVRLAYAEALAASGNRCEAERVTSDAMLWLQRRSETLDNPTMQSAFLERIPEHRRILELASEFGLATKLG
jgi:tetratricopeptide (TPR) repeat protein